MADDAPESQDLAAVMVAYAKALSDDLSDLVAADIVIGQPEFSTVGPLEVAADDSPVAQTVCKNKNEETQNYFCTMNREIAVTLACMLMGYPEERVKEKRELPLDEESLDAFGEVMNLGTAVLSRLFTDQFDLPPVGVESMSDVQSPKESDSPWSECEELAVVRFSIKIAEGEEGSFVIALPPELAHGWFGMEIGPFSQSGPVVVAEHDLEDVEPTQIVFIEPSEDVRNEIEDLEEGMIHSVWTMDPGEFDPDEMEEFAEVGAFFIEWDLVFRTGLDLLECLRNTDFTRNTPVLMMSRKPTDSIVRTAIRSGASSFVIKPIEQSDFETILDPLLLARQRALAAAS